MEKEIKVATIIVSYNRSSLLKQSLEAINNQSRSTDYLIVVDNNSTDDSLEVASCAKNVTKIVNLKENLGGAGGFTAGIALALAEYKPDYVWIMDDDCIPEKQALEELLKVTDSYDGQVALVASEAIWHDGTVHPMNKPRPRRFLNAISKMKAEKIACTQIRTASFVSILIDTRAIYEDGLPIGDFFIWNDDFEYTGRILKNRVGLYAPNSKVKHLTKQLAGSDKDPGERFYYEVRNKLWTYRYSKAFTLFEKMIYVLVSLRRWFITYKNSCDKSVIYSCLIKGMKDSLKHFDNNSDFFEKHFTSVKVQNFNCDTAAYEKNLYEWYLNEFHNCE